MKHYMSIHDLPSIKDTVKEAIELKKNPLQFQDLGKNKTIGLLFFNNSLPYQHLALHAYTTVDFFT